LDASTLNILLVEDNPGDARLVREYLQSDPTVNVALEHAKTLVEAQALLSHNSFDAILLDLSLPDVHGLDTLRRMRAHSAAPIIVLTGAEDDQLGLEALHEGAQDYLVKGEIPGSLLSRSIRYAIERLKTLGALRRSEERYELVIAATSDGIWDWDLVNGTLDFSAQWNAMLGYSARAVQATPKDWFNLVHPDDVGSLQERIDDHFVGRSPVFECEYRMRHQDGQMRWMLARGIAVVDQSGIRYRMVGSQSDITDRKQAEMSLQRAAFKDPLTGLDNRAQMKQGLLQALAASARRSTGVGVLFLDLDNFKSVNDTLGHPAGDHVLCVIARRLTIELREYDRIARFGGDEFMILIDDLIDVEQARSIAKRVLDSIVKPIRLNEREATLSASIGITTCMTGLTDPEYLLQTADVAMYQAKNAGKKGIAVFEPSMMNRLIERMGLEHLMRKSLRERPIKLQYQPIIELASSRIVGIEALARLQDETGKWIPPGVFIPVAESAGLMLALGEAVLEQACLDAQRLQRLQPDLTLNVNVSATQLQHKHFVARLFGILARTGFEPGLLTLEITESSVMRDTLTAIQRLHEIKQHGIAIAIDDFGTGYSSLSVLRELPVDILKIDRTFINRMDSDPDGLEIVRLVTVMARALKLSVVAEGVETSAQLHALQRLNCQLGQGYLISRPADLPVIEQFIKDRPTFLDMNDEFIKARAEQQLKAD
jgi:diguanylate cyclase (GGDEF)-like protein/PAS domain S-box-containing protein